MTADFLSEIMQKRRQWGNIFKALKEKSQPRITYPVQVSFKNRQNKDYFRYTKAERILYQQICTTKMINAPLPGTCLFRQKRNNTRQKYESIEE